jgi:ADP-heptose:LPS heptosyltransferase
VKKKCLVCELWWMGDTAQMTSILQGLLADGWDITVLGKTQSRRLIEDNYPTVRWIEFDAPWTAFQGKYRLWRWPWKDLVRVLREIRREHFAAAISTRRDPRDHVIFWLAGVPRRIGFRAPYGGLFLNEPVVVLPATEHRVEDWWSMQQRLSPTATKRFPPHLAPAPSEQERFRALFAIDGRPVLALHCGARNLVRRWPESYFRELLGQLRREFDFQLALFPDSDGYGDGLRELAEHTFTGLNLGGLKAVLSCASVFLGNDSGPGHVADALGVRAVTIFGPGNVYKMRPFDPRNLVVIRDICPYHPCSDYCRFPEPYCLTQLSPATVGGEIRSYLLESELLKRTVSN